VPKSIRKTVYHFQTYAFCDRGGVFDLGGRYLFLGDLGWVIIQDIGGLFEGVGVIVQKNTEDNLRLRIWKKNAFQINLGKFWDINRQLLSSFWQLLGILRLETFLRGLRKKF